MKFRHLDYPAGTPPELLGAAAIDALLERGDLEDWRPLVAAVKRDPLGPLSERILRVCAAHPMYGTSALWTVWIERRRREWSQPTASLAELRRRRGMTQTEVAADMDITQSDVSKLERRSDARLSTLRSYVSALGGSLETHARLEGVMTPLRMNRPSSAGAVRRSG